MNLRGLRPAISAIRAWLSLSVIPYSSKVSLSMPLAMTGVVSEMISAAMNTLWRARTREPIAAKSALITANMLIPFIKESRIAHKSVA